MRSSNFAQDKHKNQLDDEGKSYYDAHLYHVFKILNELDVRPEVLAAGLLHDTLEDTDTTLEELKKEFGDVVSDLVNEVTHEGKKDEYGFYFPRLESHEAILIKFADRLSNLSRMNKWNDERKVQYLKKSKFWKDGRDLI